MRVRAFERRFGISDPYLGSDRLSEARDIVVYVTASHAT